MLLVFRPEATLEGDQLPAHGAADRATSPWASLRKISTHGASGCCAHGVAIEHERVLAARRHSLYFRDPAGNLVELITPGVWGLPSGGEQDPARRRPIGASLDDGRLRVHRFLGGQAARARRDARSGSTT